MGYSVLLWNIPEKGLQDGDVVPVYIRSNISHVYVIGTSEGKFEVPLWQLTEPEWKGALQFKDPFSEAVNMNFFAMITREDWAAKIADAYKSYYGKEIQLTMRRFNANRSILKKGGGIL